MRASDLIKQGVTEGTNNITYKQQKGKNKFSVEMLVDGKPAGMFQYDANTGRTITELDPAHRGQGLGQRLILKGIYTAAMLGMDYVEDESRTAMFDRALDSLADAGYIVNDEEYWYVTDSGEQFLKQALKQGVAEGECQYGRYYCSTDKKWKCRQGPKQSRATEGLEDPKDNPCKDGYKPIGTKKKNGKTVPNCVPSTQK